MVRQDLLREHGPAALTDGYRVTTTVDSRLQAAANVALWRGMLDGPNGMTALLLSPLYLGGVWLGSRLYGKLDAALMRRWTLIFLVVVSAGVLSL